MQQAAYTECPFLLALLLMSLASSLATSVTGSFFAPIAVPLAALSRKYRNFICDLRTWLSRTSSWWEHKSSCDTTENSLSLIPQSLFLFKDPNRAYVPWRARKRILWRRLFRLHASQWRIRLITRLILTLMASCGPDVRGNESQVTVT